MAREKEKPPVCGDCQWFTWATFSCDWKASEPMPDWVDASMQVGRLRAPEHVACPALKRRSAA